MASLEEASRAALSGEEAALLPALSRRHREMERTALREQMNKAARMGEMKVRQEVSTLVQAVEQAEKNGKAKSRAALHHVMRP